MYDLNNVRAETVQHLKEKTKEEIWMTLNLPVVFKWYNTKDTSKERKTDKMTYQN